MFQAVVVDAVVDGHLEEPTLVQKHMDLLRVELWQTRMQVEVAELEGQLVVMMHWMQFGSHP